MVLTTRDIKGVLHHRLIPAVPVPFTGERTIDTDSHVRMADYLLDMPIGGVAVWAHTGRGLMLTEEERTEVMTHWRESIPDAVVIAGAGCPASADVASDDAYIAEARRMAEHAKDLGADAILCYPPSRFWDRPPKERDAAIVDYHHQLSLAGLPLVLFHLYESAGGIAYTANVLRDLFRLPDVIGIKIATLDSIVTFQDTARMLKSEHPDKLLITGEDRFLGYSLMMGADSALVGMGAVLTKLQADMLTAYYKEDLPNFHYRSQFVDRFGAAAFRQPVAGYIGRMLYALSWLGVVNRNAIFDPWGPAMDEREMAELGDVLSNLPTELKR